MLKRLAKLAALVCVLIGLLAVCILVLSGKVRPGSSQPDFEKLPIRKVWVTLAQNQHDLLFEQLRKFADKHAFTIQISQTNPSGEDYLVQMWRDDVELIAVDSGDPGLFKIGIYDRNAAQPVALEVVDELIIDLKGFISEIPNTTFTVKE